MAAGVGRTLTDADAEAIARAIVRVLRDERAANRKPTREPEPVISETDRAAARAYARRLGLHVKTKR